MQEEEAIQAGYEELNSGSIEAVSHDKEARIGSEGNHIQVR